MKDPRIKVIKRAALPEPETSGPPADTAPTGRQKQRDLQQAVNSWIEERRQNAQTDLRLANRRLRDQKP